MIRVHKTKHYLLMFAAIASIVLALSSNPNVYANLQEYSEEMAAISERITPAVVSIYVKAPTPEPMPRPRTDEPFWEQFIPREEFQEGQRRFFRFFREGEGLHSVTPMPGEKVGSGTGIIMDSEGHIVTSSQVIGDHGKGIRVRLADGRKVKSELIGKDPASGVAVIKIDSDDLDFVKTGDSDSIRTGELVLAFDDHLREGVAVTMGIVSATEKTGMGIVAYEDFIQTDAQIGPGSSGGPLVNAQGEVIGMLIAEYSERKATFAVPINTVRSVMDELISKGEVIRGWLGIQLQEVSAELAEKMEMDKPGGVIVVSVKSGSPAEESGIQDGDLMVEFDGKPIKNVNHIRKVVAQTRPGKEVSIKILREGAEETLTVTIGEMTVYKEAAIDSHEESGWAGIAVQKLTPELAEKFGYEGEEGVLVSHIREGSPAHEKGLQNGDLIQEVDSISINSPKEYKNAVEAAEESILLRIKRGERVWYEVIAAEEE